MKICLDELKKRIEAFRDEDFGEPLEAPAPKKMPTHIPPVGKHPRIGFTAERLPEILRDVESGDNKYAYAEVMRISEIECDGIVRDFDNQDLCNNARIVNGEFHNIILCKAFRYAAYGDEQYGYEAIYALKNYLISFDGKLREAFGAETRTNSAYNIFGYNLGLTMSHLIRTIGCAYDWCYPLLSARDKKQLVGAAMGKCRIHSEYPEFPPKRSGGITGHATEAPFMDSLLPFSLAVYDEYPEYCNMIMEIFEDTIIPGQNAMLAAGYHPQGASYGASRMSWIVFGECWYSYMFDGKKHLFDEKIQDVVRTTLKQIRPDGEMIRIGDDSLQGRRFCKLINCAMYLAGLYKDPILKGFAAEQSDDFSLFWLYDMSPIEVLLFNDARLDKRPLSDLPLVSYYKEPVGVILAKTAHNTKNAGMIYMKVGNHGTANHEHRDCGDFQIYHKGMLIGSSGTYSGYGCEHDYGYYKQTISKNSILVYNPNMPDNKKWIYSGGQRIDPECVKGHMDTLEEWMASPNYNRAKTLYGGYKTEVRNGKEEYCYSYIAGDITNAYDAETVSEVKRHMVSIATDNKVNPMLFIIYDKVTSVDENYKKSLLFHTQNKPLTKIVNGKPCTVVSNLMSRLYIQSLLSEVDHTFVGGKDKECWVVDRNIPFDFPGRVEGVSVAYNAENGLGRLEISPKAPSKENRFLTVMYVGPHTDCSPYLNFDANILQPYHEAPALENGTVVGTALLGYAVLFSKDGDYIEKDFSIELPTGVKKCMVFGLKAGKWIASNGCEYTVDEEERMAEIDVCGEGLLALRYLAK